ncbi:hypothetical protein BX666DRAFT_1943996 [Dichotomocladium elegans]|nr:hypothetical protein BX666DRAFT_1943996 [Dichotomocladium elegans]
MTSFFERDVHHTPALLLLLLHALDPASDLRACLLLLTPAQALRTRMRLSLRVGAETDHCLVHLQQDQVSDDGAMQRRASPAAGTLDYSF